MILSLSHRTHSRAILNAFRSTTSIVRTATKTNSCNDRWRNLGSILDIRLAQAHHRYLASISVSFRWTKRQTKKRQTKDEALVPLPRLDDETVSPLIVHNISSQLHRNGDSCISGCLIAIDSHSGGQTDHLLPVNTAPRDATPSLKSDATKYEASNSILKLHAGYHIVGIWSPPTTRRKFNQPSPQQHATTVLPR